MTEWQVIMTDTARNDLREIALGILEVSKDPEIAVRLVRELKDRCDILYSMPESGAVPKDYVLKALGYRYLAYKHYLVFYVTDPTEHKVFIHAFFNEKVDYFRFMRKRI